MLFYQFREQVLTIGFDIRLNNVALEAVRIRRVWDTGRDASFRFMTGQTRDVVNRVRNNRGRGRGETLLCRRVPRRRFCFRFLSMNGYYEGRADQEERAGENCRESHQPIVAHQSPSPSRGIRATRTAHFLKSGCDEIGQ